MSETMPPRSLLVPVHVDALVVQNEEKVEWSDLAPDFSRLGKDHEEYTFGIELVANGHPQERANKLLGAGVHLHFRLPGALTRGETGHQGNSDANGDVYFPAIPNRWLIQRYTNQNGTWDLKTWLVRSDVESTDGIAWPEFFKDKPLEITPVGFCQEVTAPYTPEDERSLRTMTAIGPGYPAFSAFYPACRSVLGFHEATKTLPDKAVLSYVVTGWHSDPKDDLLAQHWPKDSVPGPDATQSDWERQYAELQAWADERGWKLADAPADDKAARAPLPSRLLYHGAVMGVRWGGPEKAYATQSTFPEGAAHTIGIGNAPAEALAGLLSEGVVDQDLLAALHDDVLSQPVTVADLQHELHARRFAQVNGGTVFHIRYEGEESQSVKGQPPPPTPPVPAVLQKLLRYLNAAQRKLDGVARRLEDCQWQVYASWYLWTYQRRVTYGPEADARQERLEQAKAALVSERRAWTAAAARRDGLRKAIERRLQDYPALSSDGTPRLRDGKPQLSFRLSKAAGPCFYRPNDLALALRGPAMAPWNTTPDSGKSTICRLSDHALTGVTFTPKGGMDLTITAEALLQVVTGTSRTPMVTGLHRRLLGEALLLDPQLASVVVDRLPERYRAELAPKVRQRPSAGDARFDGLHGTPPDPRATFDWTGNPWRPLFAVWAVGYSDETSGADSTPALPEQLIVDRWKLGENEHPGRNADFAALPSHSRARSCRYVGHSILTASSSAGLAKRLQDFAGEHSLLAQLGNQHAQTLILDGLNDRFLRQQTGMHLPPLDYEKKADDHVYQLDGIYEITRMGEDATTPRTAPTTVDDPFLPIRFGQVSLQEISIVDAFGRITDLDIGKINGSAGLPWKERRLRIARSCAPPSSDKPSAIELRPRYSQAMRLRFEWEPASDVLENNASPVCGWIVPNHMDKSLLVFSSSGVPLRIFQRALGVRSGDGRKAFTALDFPGAPGSNSGQRDAIENTHLRYFCQWLTELSPDQGSALSHLVERVLESADLRIPEKNADLSILMGRPLALVCARLGLETWGLPAHRPELRTAAPADGRIDPLLDTSAFERVKWPVRLGDIHARNDGLIGAFRCTQRSPGGPVESAGKFYPVWGESPLDDAAFEVQNLTIDAAEDLHVTMLIDPQALVHATTGVLPRGRLELPREDAISSKRPREICFQAMPVLSPSDRTQLPKPSDDYGEWSWAYRPSVTQWSLDPCIVEATDRAAFTDAWPEITEGWLKLVIGAAKIFSFWLSEPLSPASPSDSATTICLAWSLDGAEALRLDWRSPDGSFTGSQTWNVLPLPREYRITVKPEVQFRLTIFADGKEQDHRELTIGNTP